MLEKINSNYARKCIVTNTIVPIEKLVRFDYVKSENLITLDLSKNKKGRGAYFIPTLANWEKIKKSKALNRVFRFNVDKEVYEQIEQQLKEVLYE
ncbi:YlxR family protein [Mycoplasma buteonis]|uniref:YlxR family protein n=1 Tax=Mycoplasma buteonis TaxID=171280 RepID=UPI000A9AB807|nr:YlxR family protein [Mycoplasma buteonis]